MEKFVKILNSIIWSHALIVLCLGVGVYFTVKTRFVQVRLFREMIRLLFKDKSSGKGVSSFQAFVIALSGRIGVANIAGVAIAIATGGPGAVFWMWLVAFLGAASACIESTLGQLYKEEIDGEYRGGPPFYIAKGIGKKWYAALFAYITILSMAFFLPGIQSNTMAVGMENAYGTPVHYTGVIMTGLLALVIFGGVKRIGRVAEIMVPFMTCIYLVVAFIILAYNVTSLPAMLSLIVRSAFGLEQTLSGLLGICIISGVRRGIASNGAGMGAGAYLAAAADAKHPAAQGLIQAFSVYIDTLIVCTATAFMILLTGKYNVANPEGGFMVYNLTGVKAGTAYVQFAVNEYFPSFGQEFVALSLLFFAFTTLMAFYYIAETNVSYLARKTNRGSIRVLRLFFLLGVLCGSMGSTKLIWAIGDIGIGLMAWLNMIALILLRKPALNLLQDYIGQRKNKKEPTFPS